MTTPAIKPVGASALKSFFGRDAIKNKFSDMMGKKATSFITTTLQLCTGDDRLVNATPASVYGAVMTAATLDLPINPNLGFAYIIAYSQKIKGSNPAIYETVAQFQLGYKGFVQLAQRSGQVKTISATPIYKGQIVSENPLTGYQFDFSVKESDEIIGYAAYIALLNGFEKTSYMSVKDLDIHARKYSQSFKNGFGIWKDNFEAMAMKTVIKLLLSKYAPLSVDMQKGIEMDQAVIDDTDGFNYVDNEEEIQEAVDVTAKKNALKEKKNKIELP